MVSTRWTIQSPLIFRPSTVRFLPITGLRKLWWWNGERTLAGPQPIMPLALAMVVVQGASFEASVRSSYTTTNCLLAAPA
jgi:hypothetical protein